MSEPIDKILPLWMHVDLAADENRPADTVQCPRCGRAVNEFHYRRQDTTTIRCEWCVSDALEAQERAK